MPVDFAKRRQEAEAAGMLGSGDYLKLKEGDNRLRLMSECLPHMSTFEGRKNFKWLCYVIDRRDGKIKPFFMPHKIYKAIEALQLNPDYEFVDVPMPYDLTINAVKAGTKDVVYTVVPARKNTDVTDAELDELGKAKPLAELHRLLKEKEATRANGGRTPSPANEREDEDEHIGPVDDDSVPF